VLRKPRLSDAPVIFRNYAGELIGNFAVRIDRFKAEIGYLLAVKYWGKGYATEAAAAVIRQLFKNSGIFRIWPSVTPKIGLQQGS